MITVIIPFFDFTNNPILLKNHMRMVESLDRQQVKHLTIAINLTNSHKLPIYKTEYGGCIRRNTKSILWHKEQLINLGAKLTDSKYVAWIDSGIILEDSWVDKAIEALQQYDIVQCFSEGKWISQDGNVEFSTLGYVYAQYNDIKLDRMCAPGGAFIAKKSFFDYVGLYAHHIVGGGDSFLIEPFFNTSFYSSVKSLSNLPLLNEHYKQWMEKLLSFEFNIGYIDGIFTHLWHGNISNRKYVERHNLLIKNSFNPSTDLEIANYILEWTGNNPSLERDVADYLTNKKLEIIKEPPHTFLINKRAGVRNNGGTGSLI